MAAGPRSLLAFWMGGAGAPPAAVGVRSMLAPWIGGASAPPNTQAGYTSLLAFWAGGAAGLGDIAPPDPGPSPPGGRRIRVPAAMRLKDDDDLLLLIAAQLAASGLLH